MLVSQLENYVAECHGKVVLRGFNPSWDCVYVEGPGEQPSSTTTLNNNVGGKLQSESPEGGLRCMTCARVSLASRRLGSFYIRPF